MKVSHVNFCTEIDRNVPNKFYETPYVKNYRHSNVTSDNFRVVSIYTSGIV
jgi:hypothetical protein